MLKELKRVVVTGMGAITPLGNSIDEFWKNIISGKSGIGAGALIIESLDAALARDANIIVEVVGGGKPADAYHLTGTHPEGEGAYLGMLDAKEDAGIDASQNDYLNAHATSTHLGDESESKAIMRVFGDKK